MIYCFNKEMLPEDIATELKAKAFDLMSAELDFDWDALDQMGFEYIKQKIVYMQGYIETTKVLCKEAEKSLGSTEQ